MIALAGTVSHDLYEPARLHDVANHYDLDRAREIIGPFKTSDEHREAYIDKLRLEVCDRIRQWWPLVQRLAVVLLGEGEMEGEDFLRMARAHARQTAPSGPSSD